MKKSKVPQELIDSYRSLLDSLINSPFNFNASVVNTITIDNNTYLIELKISPEEENPK